ncbi:MAG: O-acetyl-ADP-ribose deacetylase [Clostridia bacterium]|nr:O-acetyl-ADP-ribose deacetylase [Clostridia bacterium]
MPFLIERNDITRLKVDAIVNAANNSLLGGGGVDGAIHRAAGPRLLKECRKLGGCRTGEAKATGAYRLPCKWVIHTVGPIWQGGGNGERELLASCYRNSLRLAAELGCESVAFPLISAGAYGYPRAEALEVATQCIREFLETSEMTVRLVIFDRGSFVIGSGILGRIEAYIDDRYAKEHSESNSIKLARRKAAMMAGSFAARRDEALVQLHSAEPVTDDEREVCEFEDACAPAPAAKPYSAGAIEGLTVKLDESFSRTLLRLIDASGMTDAECYKRANIDRKLFSKIRSDDKYRPSKPTVIAFAVALRLDIAATEDLLKRAGLALSPAFKFDVIVEYFITNGIYDIYEINEVLFAYDQQLLGAQG